MLQNYAQHLLVYRYPSQFHGQIGCALSFIRCTIYEQLNATSSSIAPDSSLGPLCRTFSFTPIFRFLKFDNRNLKQIFRRQPYITMFAIISLFWYKVYWVNRWVQIISIDLPVYTCQPNSYARKKIGNLKFAYSIAFILLIGI